MRECQSCCRARAHAHVRWRIANGVPRVIDTPASDASLLFINMPINFNVVAFDLGPSHPSTYPPNFYSSPFFLAPATRLINFVRDMSRRERARGVVANVHIS